MDERRALERMERYAVVNCAGKTCVFEETEDADDRPIVNISTPREIKLYYSNELVESVSISPRGFETVKVETLGEWWLKCEKRRTYKGICFKVDDVERPGYYNYWKGWAVGPIEGDCSLYWQHVKDNICCGDEEKYQYVRKWMALTIQYPGELPETALVLRGMQGVGKNVFVEGFANLFREEHYAELQTMNSLCGRFTGHMVNKVLIFANEATWGGDKQSEGALKAMITDRKRYIEYKGKDGFWIDNYSRLIIASNSDWIVPVGMDDRRFVLFDVSDAHKEDHKYFTKITQQMQKGGWEALMYELRHEDVEKFNARKRPTEAVSALLDQKLRSMTDHEQFIVESVLEDRFEEYEDRNGYTVPHNALYTKYIEWCKERNARRPLSSISFAMYVWGNKGSRKLLPAERVEDRSNRAGRTYRLPERTELKKWMGVHVLNQAFDEE